VILKELKGYRAGSRRLWIVRFNTAAGEDGPSYTWSRQ
jgi:ribosomal protein L20